MSSAGDTDFDRGAAVTRSLLGWGVLLGPLYLVVGLALALTRDGFDLGRHALSLLLLGDGGWMQRTNLIVSGVLTLVAAAGFSRAMAGTTAGRRTAALLAVFGLGVIGSGLFPPDPVAGFPTGADGGEATTGGLLHLVFGGIGFLALAAATQTAAGWMRGRGDSATASRVAGAVVLLGFVGGAALATSSLGALLLWVAVVAGYAWLSATSAYLYRTVPHPDAHRRTAVSG